MPDQIERLTATDFDEAMETMGITFGFEEGRSFPMLLPQIYRPTDEWMRCNYAIRRDGRIVSLVGVFPRDWRVGETTLKLAGIGGVCTLEAYRGQGLMKALMDHCVEEMKSEGYHISWLGGQRQRYQYYGYETCGTRYAYRLSPRNVHHAGRVARPIQFELLQEENTEWVTAARALHEQKPVHVIRSQEDFILYLKSGYCEPWVALEKGKVIGYISVRDNGVREVAAESPDAALDVLSAWANRVDALLNVTVQPDDAGLARALGTICEDASVADSSNWQVFDWVTTLGALLNVKQATTGLADGRVCVRIGNETLNLCMDGGQVSCEVSGETPDLALAPFEAHRLLFGPALPGHVVEIPDQARILESWLPLPLGFGRADSV